MGSELNRRGFHGLEGQILGARTTFYVFWGAGGMRALELMGKWELMGEMGADESYGI